MLALVLTGRLGSGKTAVAAEVQHGLEERGLRSAAIDLDWLCWVGPDLDDDTLSGLLTRNSQSTSAAKQTPHTTNAVTCPRFLYQSKLESPWVDHTPLPLCTSPPSPSSQML